MNLGAWRRARCVRALATGLAVLLGASNGALARQPVPERDPQIDCVRRVMQLAVGAHSYADKHAGRLPPDLYSVMARLAESGEKEGGGQVGEYARTHAVSPAHEGLLVAPAAIDAPWVNEHSSYRYLGNADVSLNDIQEWGEIVIAHLRLDQGHPAEVTPANPEGQVFTLAFLDGHAMIATRSEAERLIAKSVATLEALRTGADAPPDTQAVQNLGMILRAIRAYASAHGGSLPPDLGATLAFVPADTKSTATPKQRGRIFLSPRAQKSGSVPDDPTPDWVNANTGYVYLGTPEIGLDEIPEPGSLVLVHARLQDAVVEVGIDGTKHERVPVGEAGGRARLESREYAEWIVRESQRAYLALASGGPLPEWVHAMRDMRLISGAIRAHAKARGGALPANLGEALEFLPEDVAEMSAPGAAARVFLSPRDELTTEIPEQPTPQWIAANSSYIYHALPGARMPEGMDVNWLPLLHGRVEEAYRVRQSWSAEPIECVPTATAYGDCMLMQKEWVVERLRDPGTTPRELGGRK